MTYVLLIVDALEQPCHCLVLLLHCTLADQVAGASTNSVPRYVYPGPRLLHLQSLTSSSPQIILCTSIRFCGLEPEAAAVCAVGQRCASLRGVALRSVRVDPAVGVLSTCTKPVKACKDDPEYFDSDGLGCASYSTNDDDADTLCKLPGIILFYSIIVLCWRSPVPQ